MPDKSLNLLARFTASIRSGRVIELVDETPGQRIERTVTRFRLGRSRTEDETEFQIEVETTCRGRVAQSAFSYCDWTPQGILETLVEYDESGDINELLAIVPENDQIAQVIETMDTVDFAARPYLYRFVDGAIQVRGFDGNWGEPSSVHHTMDHILMLDLPSNGTKAAIAA